MTRDYEILYIIDPDASEDSVTGLMDRFQQLVVSQSAEVQKLIRWDKRRLAYEIKGKREGIYVDMHLRATPEAIAETERLLRITDGILRHITVRKDEKQGSDYVPEPAPPAPEPRPEEPPAPPPPAPAAEIPAAGGEAAAETEAPAPEAGATEATPAETTEPEAAAEASAEPTS